MAETLRQLGLDRTRARKGAVRPELTPSQIRGLLADVATGGGVPFIDAASQAAQGNYGQAAVSGLLDAPPVKMAGMVLAPLIGMVRKAAPMDEALRIAQKNAAKPVSEGGLGLPPDNTPMDRARAMGFDTPVFHSSLKDVAEFKPHGEFMGHQGVSGVSVTDSPEMASRYLDRYADYGFVDGVPNQAFSKNVLPLMMRKGNFLEAYVSPYKGKYGHNLGAPLPENYQNPMIADGIDTLIIPDAISRKGAVKHSDAKNAIKGKELIAANPNQIRSRFAAFDPARINENNLLASLAALGISVPVMRGLLQEEEMQ